MKNKALNIATAFGCLVVYTMLLNSFMGFLYNAQFFSPPGKYFVYFMSLVWAPLVEEAIFRWAPLTLQKSYNIPLWPVIVLSSSLFGWLHGGPHNLLIQGVYGVVFALVYVKNGHCYWSSVSLHFLWNFHLIFVSYR